MFIVRVKGGLGNQLFQYAFALSISRMRRIPFKLDLHWFDLQEKRKFILDRYAIDYQIAIDAEVDLVSRRKTQSIFQLMDVLIRGRLPYYTHHVIAERINQFDDRVFRAPEDCYFDGYWQNEKYFFQYRQALLSSLVLKKSIFFDASKLLDRIQQENSVSLHIRCGDYIQDKRISSVYEHQTMDYYTTAIETIRKTTNSPLFCVFSDDISWVKENMNFSSPVIFIDPQEKDACEELYLMSQCKHNIIANSSFSWWGAWLNTNPSKTVIAPKKWLVNKEVNHCPESWLLL